ncbi:uncharacterized protein [Watersipora subatra]|uniref:uncharacterized protein n=1 Tax=Watersipora subatra TaxID=2589382 RepID=UPI00355C18CB
MGNRHSRKIVPLCITKLQSLEQKIQDMSMSAPSISPPDVFHCADPGTKEISKDTENNLPYVQDATSSNSGLSGVKTIPTNSQDFSTNFRNMESGEDETDDEVQITPKVWPRKNF